MIDIVYRYCCIKTIIPGEERLLGRVRTMEGAGTINTPSEQATVYDMLSFFLFVSMDGAIHYTDCTN